MFSTLAAYGFFFICLSAISAMLAAMLAGVYWRSGPVAGLITLGGLGLAGTWVLSGDFTIPIVVLAAVLIHAVDRRWSLSRAIWQAFALNALVILAWLVMVYLAFQARPYATAEIEEMLRELEVEPWMVGSAPGFLLASQFIAAWMGVLFSSSGRADLWPRQQVQDWEVPWYLIWVLIGCGFGVWGLLQGMIADTEDGILQAVFASGAVLAASWFLVQGFLVGVVALKTWKLPAWLGILAMLSMWHFLPLLGVAEIWGGFRARMRAAAAAREEGRKRDDRDF